MKFDPVAILASCTLRVTTPRRRVLHALHSLRAPADPQRIHAWIARQGSPVNLVTVYRVLQVLLDRQLVHRHPESGGYTLCCMPQQPGHHVLLTCESCGRTDEAVDAELCSQEDRVAVQAGYLPRYHTTSIRGFCAACR